MVNLHTALFHHFPELTVADRICHLSADTPQDDTLSKMAALKLDRHLLAPRNPLPESIRPGGRQPEICDRTQYGIRAEKMLADGAAPMSTTGMTANLRMPGCDHS